MPHCRTLLDRAQLDTVRNLTAPLQPRDRSQFLQRLAEALSVTPAFGDDDLYRTCRDLQLEFIQSEGTADAIDGRAS
jgi:hypothetical protein